MLRLWVHEALRIYADPFPDPRDRAHVENLVADTLRINLGGTPWAPPPTLTVSGGAGEKSVEAADTDAPYVGPTSSEACVGTKGREGRREDRGEKGSKARTGEEITSNAGTLA